VKGYLPHEKLELRVNSLGMDSYCLNRYCELSEHVNHRNRGSFAF